MTKFSRNWILFVVLILAGGSAFAEHQYTETITFQTTGQSIWGAGQTAAPADPGSVNLKASFGGGFSEGLFPLGQSSTTRARDLCGFLDDALGGFTWVNKANAIICPGLNPDLSPRTCNFCELDTVILQPFYDTIWELGDIFTPGDFGLSLTANASGSVEFEAGLTNIEGGSMDVNLPLDVSFNFNPPNTFEAGDTVIIDTSYVVGEGFSIAMTAPTQDLVLKGKLSLTADFKVNFIVENSTTDGIQFNVPTVNSVFDIYQIGNGNGTSVDAAWAEFPAFFNLPDVGCTPDNNLPYNINPCEAALSGVSGFLDLPNFEDLTSEPLTAITTTTGGTVAVWNGVDQFVGLDMDPISWTKVPLSGAVPVNSPASASYSALTGSVVINLFSNQTFEIDPGLSVTLTFDEAVAISAGPPAGPLVSQGTSTSVTTAVGNRITIVYPAGRTTPMTVTPTYTSSNSLTSVAILEQTETVGLSGLAIEADLGPLTILPEQCVDLGPLGNLCIGPWAIPKFEFDLGPAFSVTSPDITPPVIPVINDSWTLGGGNMGDTLAAPAFVLTPGVPEVTFDNTTPPEDVGPGQDRPPEVLEVREDGTVVVQAVEGSTIVLTAPEGSDYQWFKDGVLLAGETNRTLTIVDLGPEDNGLYRVTYDDGVPAKAPASFEIELGVVPPFPVAGAVGLAVTACLLLLAAGFTLTSRKRKES